MTSATKHNFVTRDMLSDTIFFWEHEPKLEDGMWCKDGGGAVAEIDADTWSLLTGTEFVPGTIIKDVQINTNWTG